MKLLRHGPSGEEKPGLLDAEGVVRDLSGHVADIDGATLASAQLVSDGKSAKVRSGVAEALDEMLGETHLPGYLVTAALALCLVAVERDQLDDAGRGQDVQPPDLTAIECAQCEAIARVLQAAKANPDNDNGFLSDLDLSRMPPNIIVTANGLAATY